MVWRYAASPNGKLDLSIEIFYQHSYRHSTRRFWEVVSPAKIYSWQRFLPIESEEREGYLSRRDCKDTSSTRTTLMGVCKLSREVVIQLWRESVKDARGETHWREEREENDEVEDGMRERVLRQVEGRRFARE